jgi:predicted dehydrogenase
VSDCRRVVEAWRRAGTAGAIGYNFRRNPIFEAARRTVASGALGQLVGIQGSFHWAAERIEGWRSEPGMGGSALHDLVSHHVDLVTALTESAIVRVQCTLRSRRYPDDTASLQMTTADGLTVQLQGSSAAGAPVNGLVLTGTRGVLRVDLLDGRPRPVDRAPGPRARLIRVSRALAQLHPARLLRSPGFEPSFRNTIEAFLEAARDGIGFRPDLSDGLRALAVIAAAETSARAGGSAVPVEGAS